VADKSDLPSFEKYFAPTVRAMRARGGSATIEELEEDVAKLMGLPESLLAIPHKNGPRSQFAYELAWVRTYLKKLAPSQPTPDVRQPEMGHQLLIWLMARLFVSCSKN
jgi:Mrr N-terminal domain